MKCMYCAAENKENARFCTKCGQPLTAEQPEGYFEQDQAPFQGSDPLASDYLEPAAPYDQQQTVNYQQQYVDYQQPAANYQQPPANYQQQYQYQQPVVYPVPQPKKKSSGLRVFIVTLAVILSLSVLGGGGYYLATGRIPFAPSPDSAPALAVPTQNSAGANNGEAQVIIDDPVDVSDEETAAQPETEAPVLKSATYFKSAYASSVLGDMAGHSYGAGNVLNDDETCWCEGAKGYGVGESITLELPERQRVSGLYIRNGYAGTEKQYNDNAKINNIKISFSDGQYTSATLKTLSTAQRKSIQKLTFAQPVDTSSVTITIVSVTEAPCEDTCLTYVQPF